MSETRPQLGLLILGLLIHPILENLISPWGVSPDMIYLLVFWIAMRRGRLPAMFWAFGLGLIRDLGDFSVLGASPLAYSSAAFLLGGLRDRVDRENQLMRALLFLIGALLAQFLYFLVSAGAGADALLMLWLKIGWPVSLLSLLLYFLVLGGVYLAGEGLQRFREPDEELR